MTNTDETASLGACVHAPLFTRLPAAGADDGLAGTPLLPSGLPSESVVPGSGVFEAGGAEAVVHFSSAENPFLSPLDLLEVDQNSCDTDSGGSAPGSSILGDSVTGDSSDALGGYSTPNLDKKKNCPNNSRDSKSPTICRQSSAEPSLVVARVSLGLRCFLVTFFC